MKKLKCGVSFVLLVIVCVLTQKILLLINYILALLLHELAHVFVAAKYGYNLKEFKINVFGISVELDEKIEDKDSFAINIAGPLFNLFLAILCMAFYWLVPVSFKYLNIFCVSNLTLAVFNLLPIYPLDGGKIFKSLIQNTKIYNKLNKIIKIFLVFLTFSLFLLSTKHQTNWLFLVLTIFFLLPNKSETNMSVFKFSKHKKFEKVVILKAGKDETLFNLLKKIKSNVYTIFYINSTRIKCLDEDLIIDFSTKYPLTTKIKEII